MGVTGIVELLATDEVIKSARPGEDEALCRKEMCIEAEVYRRLRGKFGLHERFLQCTAFDDAAATLTLEYMPKGSLRNYLLLPDTNIEYEQRYEWTLAAAEALALLHSIAVVHCDFSPKNMLLDSSLGLKVAGRRFWLQRDRWGLIDRGRKPALLSRRESVSELEGET